jgi:hypothetical protein
MTLYYYEEMTMREIGLAVGVVESRVSQIHASAVIRLRVALKDLATHGVFDRTHSHGTPIRPKGERDGRGRARGLGKMMEGRCGGVNG